MYVPFDVSSLFLWQRHTIVLYRYTIRPNVVVLFLDNRFHIWEPYVTAIVSRRKKAIANGITVTESISKRNRLNPSLPRQTEKFSRQSRSNRPYFSSLNSNYIPSASKKKKKTKKPNIKDDSTLDQLEKRRSLRRSSFFFLASPRLRWKRRDSLDRPWKDRLILDTSPASKVISKVKLPSKKKEKKKKRLRRYSPIIYFRPRRIRTFLGK